MSSLTINFWLYMDGLVTLKLKGYNINLFVFSSGHQRRCELFNTTDLTWTVLSPLNLGRGQHACTWFQGNIVAAGGWSIVSEHF